MPGAERLRDCPTLQKILQKQVKEKRPLGAICAAPAVILEANGWLKVSFSAFFVFGQMGIVVVALL